MMSHMEPKKIFTLFLRSGQAFNVMAEDRDDLVRSLQVVGWQVFATDEGGTVEIRASEVVAFRLLF